MHSVKTFEDMRTGIDCVIYILFRSLKSIVYGSLCLIMRLKSLCLYFVSYRAVVIFS